MALDFGIPTEPERETFADIVSHAFAADPKMALNEWFVAAGFDNLRVVREAGAAVGGWIVIPMGQYFGGRSVPMTGIAGVAVAHHVHRRGIATDMMAQAVRELAEEGVALSTLYASTQSLYRKVGFEPAGSRYIARVQPRDIGIREPARGTERYLAENRAEVISLYDSLASASPGFIERGPYVWSRILDARFGKEAHGVLFRDPAGNLEGCVFYRKHSSRGEGHRIEVTELLGKTSQALRQAWSFLGDLSTSVVDELTFTTAPTDPAYLVHPNPQFQVRLHENWMMRIAHLPSALEARGYAHALDLEVDFCVSDDIVSANTGQWHLVIRDGRGHVERGGTSNVQVDARGLAALYSGFADAVALRQLGRVHGDDRELQRLSLAFAGPHPWMREMF